MPVNCIHLHADFTCWYCRMQYSPSFSLITLLSLFLSPIVSSLSHTQTHSHNHCDWTYIDRLSLLFHLLPVLTLCMHRCLLHGWPHPLLSTLQLPHVTVDTRSPSSKKLPSCVATLLSSNMLFHVLSPPTACLHYLIDAWCYEDKNKLGTIDILSTTNPSLLLSSYNNYLRLVTK